MDELDSSPTTEEIDKATDNLACGKAPGTDGIPAEVLKSGKPALLEHLHELLCLCWEEGHIPQDMRDANIVILYKNKGDRSDCNNYPGISLLSIVGKVFALVALTGLQFLATRVYPESQCGFRASRSVSMGGHPKPSQSAAGWNRGVSLRRHFSVYFSPCSSSTPSGTAARESTSTPGQTESSSALPDCVRKQKSHACSPTRCYSRTTQPWLLTQKTACSSLSVVSTMPARSSVWPSV